MNNELNTIINKLEETKKLTKNDGEYWMGRDIQEVLGYATWGKFENVISKAMMACESVGYDKNDHFLQTGKMVPIGSGAQIEKKDYFLTRYACYLIAMNGDSGKAEIGIAQTYFAVQTRKQELNSKLTEDERRIQLRGRVTNAIKKLNEVAKQIGVQKYGLFHDAGYKGLYDMGLAEIKSKKGLLPNEDLLDRAGRVELAANEFRITQTEEKLVRDKITGQHKATETHLEVGKEVRKTILKIGGITPENLQTEPSIKKLVKRNRKGGNGLIDGKLKG